MTIPRQVQSIIEKIEERGFQAFIVGGCVRDILRKAKPQDWDITTNAKPEEIQNILAKTELKTFLDNRFGTVTVLTDSNEKTLKTIEITPFRKEGRYSDKRHPDRVEWVKKIEQDLARRDFTINAMALKIQSANLKTKSEKLKCKILNKIKIIDIFNGQNDLKRKIVRAVGEPSERFNEDALRILRAVRLAVQLNFKIEKRTVEAIKELGSKLNYISAERIKDEFIKIIMAKKADRGVELLRKYKLLKYIIPELLEGYGIGQNKHHIYEVYQHNLLSLKAGAQRNFNKYVRIAALFHDIGKPRAKQGQGTDSTFYNHEIIGAKITKKILLRLKFSKKDIEKITKLVRYHLFYYNPNEVGESSVRRLIRKVGIECMDELLQVRICDRIGSGVKKAEPYKLRHLRYLIEKLSQDPISPKTLKINGYDIMKIIQEKTGPKIGMILNILLAEILDDSNKNKKDYLAKRVKEINKLKEEEIKRIGERAKEKIEKIEIKKDQMTKKKYWVV